jgi:hypothetical protein
MKKIFFAFVFFCAALASNAQKIIESRLLSEEERLETIDIHVIEDFKIYMQVYKVYEIKYLGVHDYLVLCESRDEIKNNDKDTINKKIKAVLLRRGGSGIEEKVWEINDNIVVSPTEESSIWFWTRYLDFQDFDNDGEVDYTLLYGTKAMNGLSDGRLKIAMVNKKGEKIFIRHQNGSLDFERETKIDKGFYALPRTWQMAMQKRMKLIEKEERAIFPAGWEAAMKNFKTIINERK